MVIEADTKSASMFGKKWKLAHPPSTMPMVRIRLAAPSAAVA